LSLRLVALRGLLEVGTAYSCRNSMRFWVFALLLLPRPTTAATLTGFGLERLGPTSGFATSIAIDSRGTVYYTSTNGNLFRFENGQSALVAHVVTQAIGDSGLLGMALRDDNTAVVHYTTAGQVADIISTIDLTTGREAVLQSLICDKELPARGSPAEHHGGNPSIGSDGSIFVGIGDYGGGEIAALPDWNGGKVFRIHPDGTLEQFARGFRNPFGMVWDAANQRLIATDNGDIGNDEINIVHQGDFCGWPFTEGSKPPVDGAVPPVYTFPVTVAPTGMIALSGRNPTLSRGYLIAAFVTKAIYYVADIDLRPLPEPTPIISNETEGVIGLAEAPNGDILFITGQAIYKLHVPHRIRAVRKYARIAERTALSHECLMCDSPMSRMVC
jgi:glucose/arabinose dehydrogenase